jgi:hypothetical protein
MKPKQKTKTRTKQALSRTAYRSDQEERWISVGRRTREGISINQREAD